MSIIFFFYRGVHSEPFFPLKVLKEKQLSMQGRSLLPNHLACLSPACQSRNKALNIFCIYFVYIFQFKGTFFGNNTTSESFEQNLQVNKEQQHNKVQALKGAAFSGLGFVNGEEKVFLPPPTHTHKKEENQTQEIYKASL